MSGREKLQKFTAIPLTFQKIYYIIKPIIPSATPFLERKFNMSDTTVPIYNVPEVQYKVKKVNQFIEQFCRAKNYFAWKHFIDDLKVDIELEIYKYEDLHRQGKYKDNGIGAYCNMAKQGAINYSWYYQALKRKANFVAVSLDATYRDTDPENSGTPIYQIPDIASQQSFELVDLLESISAECGAEIASIVQRVFDGEQLDKTLLQTLRKSNLKKLLKRDFA